MVGPSHGGLWVSRISGMDFSDVIKRIYKENNGSFLVYSLVV